MKYILFFMNNIIKYIEEKLKINSKSKINNIEIRIDQEELNTFKFSQEEINEILNYCKDLPIIPNYLSRGMSPIIINFCYNKNKTFNNDYFSRNLIRIKKYSNKELMIRFIMVDCEETFFYPSDGKYYTSIKECFEYIHKYWKELDFSKHIKKYL